MSSHVVLTFRCSSGFHLTSVLRTSSSTDSSASTAQIVVEFDGVDQRVQKLQRSEKFPKAIGSEERLPKHWSSVNKELELPLKLCQFFEIFLLGPKSSLDTTFGAITDKAKASGDVDALSFFSARGARKIFNLNTRILYQL